MQKLLIIDGHNLLFQMFFGMPSRIVNKDGKAMQGTLGFVGALLKIIGMTSPTHLVVLFDGEHENPRTGLAPEYKGNRTDFSQAPDEENPFSQLSDVYSALDFMGIAHTEVTYGETDDVIASYAIKYGTKMKIVISSFDSDFFQLINHNVSVLRYRGEKTVLCGCDYIREKFGISPKQYADFKSLTGDSSDNIKGAERIGPKTAAQLISQFNTLDEIIINASQIVKPSIRESVLKNSDRLKINQKLIRLDGSAPVPFGIDELEYRLKSFKTKDILIGIGLQ